MKVIVDIGNSNVVIGIYGRKGWEHLWRLPTIQTEDTAVYYNLEISNRILETGLVISETEGIILSTVVPVLREVFEELLEISFGATVLVVGPNLYKYLRFDVPRPYEIGTDIVANAYCAYRKYGGHCIVVDFGTALTFTTVDAAGYIKGVAIAPGIKTAMKALSSNTAQLPEIPLELPSSALGRNTTHAIQAGILWGYVGMVKQLLLTLRQEVGEEYTAIATGGLSFVMSEVQDMFSVIDRELTITGLLQMLEDAMPLDSWMEQEE